MDFTLTDEQRMLHSLCREFAEKEINPHASEWNRTRRFPIEVFRRMAELNLMGLLIPEAYGGTNAGAVAYVAAMEEIGAADQSVAATWNAHLTIGSLPILVFGTERQKEEWLAPLARGEKLGAFALTEPNAGSDARAIETIASLDGDAWVINGRKMFITNAGTEMSFGVIALVVTGLEPGGKKRFSNIVIPKGAPGYRVGPNLDKIGWHGTDTREQIFENCRVPRDHLLGEEGAGLRQFMTTLDAGRISIAAVSLGLIRACLEAATAYAKARSQFGKPLAQFQAIQFKLADMATELELARLITYKAAWLYDDKRPHAKEAAMAKLYTSEAAMRAAHQAVQIYGGYGYMEESPVARLYRDAKILEIGEGTSEIQRLVIARQLGC
ncbi:MAG: acyl-CoA dehydrogenase family protein [Nitrospinae bacterium]|nr:acyl-CoA dehydrogenase family protein [Nitrospinota bacterium]